MHDPDPSSRPVAEPSGRRLALRGSLWTLLGYGGSQLLRLGSNLVLAWLLFPEAFGLMALVAVFMHGLQMFTDIGLGPSIIQNKRGQDPAFLHTAYSLQVLRGFLLWGLSWLLAPLVAGFFAANDPLASSLTSLLPVAALTAVIGGFSSMGIHLLNRNMHLGRLTALELLPQLVSSLVMILWALWTPSVWALVAGGLASSLVRLILSHLWNPGPRDRFGWDRDCFGELFHFGKWIFLSTLVAFLAQHLDRILLGKLLSLAELGVYSIAMTFARVPIHVSSRLSSTVIFPLLARLQDDPKALVAASLRARQQVLWISGAVCLGFALAAPLFFGLLYDPRYSGAGEISQWLALYVWSHVLMVSMDRIPLALGQPKKLFQTGLLTTLAMLLALPGYWLSGLPGFILGMTLANLLAHAYLLAALPEGRAALARQGLLFSLGLLAYVLPLLLLLREPFFTTNLWLQALVVVLGGLPPLLLGAWSLRRAMQDRKGSGEHP
jgi:O-antigen/teichoic acid export membrane protein